MTPPDIRVETAGRAQLTIASPATRQDTDHTALMVMALSLACTALAIFDLLLLATNH
jgi:phosphopantothenoylcysteine synthetase/decarboxylase